MRADGNAAPDTLLSVLGEARRQRGDQLARIRGGLRVCAVEQRERFVASCLDLLIAIGRARDPVPELEQVGLALGETGSREGLEECLHLPAPRQAPGS